MSDNIVDNNEMSKPPAPVEEGADSDELKEEEMAAKDVVHVAEDKVSIQQILEGMTNEFNKRLSIAKNMEIDHKSAKNNKLENLHKGEQQEKVSKHSKVVVAAVEEVEKIGEIEREKSDDDENETKETDVKVQDKINEQEKNEQTQSKLGKKEVSPNKESIPRIVLTFRTIDENTNDGRKTKISSCSSNLKLVPDELTNCDQIGGVSVKIENSDDNSNAADKSDDNEEKKDKIQVKKKTKEEEAKSKVTPVHNSQEKKEMHNTEKNIDSNGKKTKLNEPNKNTESVSDAKDSVPKKRRVGRPRLRALSDSTEESPGPAGPKRSARRLCKESFKSTVLESAMARKEKSNYTDERKFKNERKYSRPGRPKKIVKWKDQNKQTEAKSSEAKSENSTSNNTSELNGTQSEVNTTVETSKNASLSEKSKSDVSLDETNNSSMDFEGMPKLSPISKTVDGNQNNSSRSVPASPTGDEDASANETDKPFLKPIVSRSRRERGRPKGSGSARKIAKADSLNEGEPEGID